MKETTKGLINKYGMSLEDAEWVINKVSKSIPQPPVSTEPENKKSKKDVGVAGVFFGASNNTTTYNSDSLTKSQTVPKPASSGNSFDDEDYPIF